MYATHEAAWYFFLVGMAAVHLGVLSLSALGMCAKVRIHKRLLAHHAEVDTRGSANSGTRGSALPSVAASFVNNPRDVAFLLNACASLLRLLLTLDPISTYGRYPPFVSQVLLLRVPQLLWVTAIVNLAVVWTIVAKSVQGRVVDVAVMSSRLYVGIVRCAAFRRSVDASSSAGLAAAAVLVVGLVVAV
jgi:hypothetical protein